MGPITSWHNTTKLGRIISTKPLSLLGSPAFVAGLVTAATNPIFAVVATLSTTFLQLTILSDPFLDIPEINEVLSHFRNRKNQNKAIEILEKYYNFDDQVAFAKKIHPLFLNFMTEEDCLQIMKIGFKNSKSDDFTDDLSFKEQVLKEYMSYKLPNNNQLEQNSDKKWLIALLQKILEDVNNGMKHRGWAHQSSSYKFITDEQKEEIFSSIKNISELEIPQFISPWEKIITTKMSDRDLISILDNLIKIYTKDMEIARTWINETIIDPISKTISLDHKWIMLIIKKLANLSQEDQKNFINHFCAIVTTVSKGIGKRGLVHNFFSSESITEDQKKDIFYAIQDIPPQEIQQFISLWNIIITGNMSDKDLIHVLNTIKDIPSQEIQQFILLWNNIVTQEMTHQDRIIIVNLVEFPEKERKMIGLLIEKIKLYGDLEIIKNNKLITIQKHDLIVSIIYRLTPFFRGITFRGITDEQMCIRVFNSNDSLNKGTLIVNRIDTFIKLIESIDQDTPNQNVPRITAALASFLAYCNSLDSAIDIINFCENIANNPNRQNRLIDISNFLFAIHDMPQEPTQLHLNIIRNIDHHQSMNAIINALKESFNMNNNANYDPVDVTPKIYEEGLDVHNEHRDDAVKIALWKLKKNQIDFHVSSIDDNTDKFLAYLRGLPRNPETKNALDALLTPSKNGWEPLFGSLKEEELLIHQTGMSGREFIARIWHFIECLEEHETSLCREALVKALSSCITRDETGHFSSICNQGKIQHIVVGVLQGRLQGVCIDNIHNQPSVTALVINFFLTPQHVELANKDKNPLIENLQKAATEYLKNIQLNEADQTKFMKEVCTVYNMSGD